jgi:N-ethylmaleimide reductase
VQPELDLSPERFRSLITGQTRLIAAGGCKPFDAEAVLQSGNADAVAFGRLFLADPDLPRRFAARIGARCDMKTLYPGETHPGTRLLLALPSALAHARSKNSK